MNAFRKLALLKATELTRAGRLGEALASLRAGLTELPVAPAKPQTPSGQFLARSFSNAAGTRDYKVYIPSTYTGRPVNLVVMLHGCTQSPDDFAAGTRMNALAEAQNFIVAYPAQSRNANVSKCWNWFNAADQQRGRGEPSLIAGITRQVMADYAIDPHRIYAAGLSAGGAEAAILGETYPELFAAIGIHSGLACGAASNMASAFTAMQRGGPAGGQGPARPVPTIVFHGDQDNTVNPINADRIILRAQAGAALQTTETTGQAGGMSYTRTVMSEPGGKPILEQWRLQGAGHAWSGGSPAGTYTTPSGPDASREMLKFFAQHPAPNPVRKWFS
jgi:poly(hydroxyalkanoate) depolymerase family esterase